MGQISDIPPQSGEGFNWLDWICKQILGFLHEGTPAPEPEPAADSTAEPLTA